MTAIYILCAVVAIPALIVGFVYANEFFHFMFEGWR